ncbi:MAG: hypothetical protein Q8O25_06945 [Sulfurisoma sp.]|nr:hypothetical protein [Sulfurisoma sp.]
MKLFYAVLLLSFLAAGLCAHGVSGRAISGGAGLEALYADGEPLSFGEVKVYAPGDAAGPFQRGYTDRNGRFLFSPDSDGRWRLEINDGMGHGLVREVLVKKGAVISSGGPAVIPVPVKLLSGLGVIALLSGLWLHLAARRRLKAAGKA